MRATTKREAIKAFFGLMAADLMTAPLTTIRDDMPLKEAGHLLLLAGVSGAPVVDSDGNCVGVLSSADFVSWSETKDEAEEKRKPVSFIAPWGEIISLDGCEGCIVRDYMTKDLVTVSRATVIGEITQKMVDAHIHRVLIVEMNRPCGVVSSTDIMAAVANAARSI